MANIKKSQKKSQQPQEENIEAKDENVVLDVSQVDNNESQQPQEENIEAKEFTILNKDFFLSYSYKNSFITKKQLLELDETFTENNIEYLKAILVIK